MAGFDFPLLPRASEPFDLAFSTPIVRQTDVALNYVGLCDYAARERWAENAIRGWFHPPVMGRDRDVQESLPLLPEGFIVRGVFGGGKGAFMTHFASAVEAAWAGGEHMFLNYQDVTPLPGQSVAKAFNATLQAQFDMTLDGAPIPPNRPWTLIIDELSHMAEQERVRPELREEHAELIRMLSDAAALPNFGFATCLHENRESEAIARDLGLRNFPLPPLPPAASRLILQHYADAFGVGFEAETAQILVQSSLTPLDMNRIISAIAEHASLMSHPPNAVGRALLGAGLGSRKSTVAGVYLCLDGLLLCKSLLAAHYGPENEEQSASLERWASYGLLGKDGDRYRLTDTTFGQDLRARLTSLWPMAELRHRRDPERAATLLHEALEVQMQLTVDEALGL